MDVSSSKLNAQGVYAKKKGPLGPSLYTIELRCRAGRRRVIFHSSMGEPPLFLFGKRRVGAVAGGDTIWL